MHARDLLRRITAQGLLVLGLGAGGVVRAEDCAGLRAELDAGIRAGGERLTLHHDSALTPWLRRDRFLAAELRRAVMRGDRTARDVILDAMAALDARDLALELGGPEQVPDRVERCRSQAVAALRSDPGRLRRLAREPVPDAYVGWRRALGLYPLIRPLLRAGAARWRARERAAIAAGPPAPRLVQGAVRSERPIPRAVARTLAALRERHPLAWPAPDPDTLARLGRQFAPELATDADVPYARIGRLSGRGGRPHVDPADPVALLAPQLVRWGPHVLLQLEYTFWFTERPSEGPLDPYGGAVDGLVLRVTLGDDGRALVWESIHPCGCYYTIALPADRPFAYVRPDPARLEAPLVLAGPPAGARLRVLHTADTHYLRWARAATAPVPDARHRGYRIESRSALHAAGPARPPFDARGILRGTARGERAFLWPSGIRSPGAMRTSGRQATAFLGRRHFDRAELLGGRLIRRP